MTYIDIINYFWLKDEEHNFSPNEVTLYFYILKTANRNHWKNPVGLSNTFVIAKFGIGKTALDTAKRNLKNAGMIDFEVRYGRGNVHLYYIIGLAKELKKGTQKQPFSDTYSTTFSDTLSKRKTATSKDIEKDKEEDIYSAPDGAAHTEKNSFNPNHSLEERKKSGAKKKKEDDHTTTPHWAALVAVWFQYYEANMGMEPSFSGQAPGSLKRIATQLQQRAEAAGQTWDELTATHTLHAFLQHAIADPWLADNFLLHNLFTQFDKILNHATNGNKTPNRNGSANSTQDEVASAFAKIDRMRL